MCLISKLQKRQNVIVIDLFVLVLIVARIAIEINICLTDCQLCNRSKFDCSANG